MLTYITLYSYIFNIYIMNILMYEQPFKNNLNIIIYYYILFN